MSLRGVWAGLAHSKWHFQCHKKKAFILLHGGYSQKWMFFAHDNSWKKANPIPWHKKSFLAKVLSMSGNHFGYIQLPVLHPQTGHSANIKHKRKVEDMLLKTEADFSQSLTLVFQRESVRAGSDKRPTSQPCFAVLNSKESKWASAECLGSGLLGPLPTCSVSEMQGYDPDNKPNPSQRVEQTLGPVWVLKFGRMKVWFLLLV